MIRSIFKLAYCIGFWLASIQICVAQQTNKWGDQHNGTYANPILPGDFQNTDVIRVAGDYFYISATKELSPGMMILTSRDLVNWRIIGHAVPDLTKISPRYNYDKMQGSTRGIWAGAIRYHNDKFYIYFTTPDEGIFMTTASNAEGPWSPLVQLIKASGWDDPCPLWDDNGKAYLVATHFSDNYKIHLFTMSPDGEQLTDTSRVIHQSKGSEANKLYKINNYYYHFYSEVTAEGRIPFMARSKNITGPYNETHQLMHKAEREPNQGGLVQTEKGEWYFVTHHGIAQWEGREASLLPVTWINDWPIWGKAGADGIGNMIWAAKKPGNDASAKPIQTSDDFRGKTISPQWEWYFQPRNDKWSLSIRPGFLRLYACKPLKPGVITQTPNVLTQRPLKLEQSIITLKMDVAHMTDGQIAALALFGKTSAAIGVTQIDNAKHFYFSGNDTKAEGPEITIANIWLRATWDANGLAHFFFSTDGYNYDPLGNAFTITNFGNYLGAKIGIFTANDTQESGFVDVDYFNYEVK